METHLVGDYVSDEEKKTVIRKTLTYMKIKVISTVQILGLLFGIALGLSVGFLHSLLFSVQTNLLRTKSYNILLYVIQTAAPFVLSPNSPGVKNRVYGMVDGSLPLSMQGKKFRILRTALRKMAFKLKGLMARPGIIKRALGPEEMRKSAKSTVIYFSTSLYTLLPLLLVYSILIYCLCILIRWSVPCSGIRNSTDSFRYFLFIPLLFFIMFLSATLQVSLIIGAFLYPRLLIETVKFELGM